MITQYGSMTSAEKKAQIKKLIANGDKRSYNEIQADLELQLWTEQHGGTVYSAPNKKPVAQRRAIEKSRLEAQLKSGMKPNKFGTTKAKKEIPFIPLTDKDRMRIEHRINNLDKKVA